MSGGLKYFISGARICQGGLNNSYQGPEYVRGLKYFISGTRICQGGLNTSYQGPEYVRGTKIFHIRGQNMSEGTKYFILGA